MRRPFALLGVSVLAAGLTFGAGSASAADTPTVDSVLAEIAALQCGATFNADQGQINDDTLELLVSITSQEQGQIADALQARLAVLNYCVGDPDDDEPTTTTTTTTVPAPTVVAPTEDDDSTAVTDGSQVVDIPEGSVQTGGA